jgi:hypothetical protein
MGKITAWSRTSYYTLDDFMVEEMIDERGEAPITQWDADKSDRFVEIIYHPQGDMKYELKVWGGENPREGFYRTRTEAREAATEYMEQNF